MAPWLLLVGLVLAAPEGAITAADAVALRDGSVALGQVIDSPLRAHLILLIRRAWAAENLPAWTSRWEAIEAPLVRLGRRQRRDRLAGWRQQWADRLDRDDAALAWLGREQTRLANPRPSKSTLMSVTLSRADVRAVTRRPRPLGRLVRLGWLAGIEDVETMTPAALERALAGRGVALDGPATASVESLLPLLPESEDQWRTRRAATEVLRDPSLRYVRFTRLTLPEPAPDEVDELPPYVLDTPSALTALQSLVEITPDDPLEERLDAAADRGRVGLLVTEVEMAEDDTSVGARASLWVLRERAGWRAAASRQASERVAPSPDGAPPERVNLFQSSLLVLESVAGHPVEPDWTRETLDAGAAAQRALARARAALDLDLRDVALPLPAAP
ncbi:MAG TPA: hypothetical protein VKP69_14595 [Isosphaeraceae bacterium]|nr:hypothetical protein [Isosphaeraceae bacterium]